MKFSVAPKPASVTFSFFLVFSLLLNASRGFPLAFYVVLELVAGKLAQIGVCLQGENLCDPIFSTILLEPGTSCYFREGVGSHHGGLQMN